MSKAKEISALYKDIKQQMGKLVSLCHEVEDHAEATADAYQRGYEAGLNDKKEGKATCQYCEYEYLDETEEPCKKCCNAYMNKYKPKAKKEQIQVGDEVKNTQTDARFIVTHMWENNHGEKGVSGFNYECSAFSTALDLVRKTGRHFPEIAEVLQKMKES